MNRLILSFILLVIFSPAVAWPKDYLYVTNIDANLISIIDGDEGLVIKEVPLGIETCDIAIDPRGQLIAVSHEEKIGDVWLMDRLTLQVKHKVVLVEEKEGRKANGFFLAFSKDSRKLYAANQFSGDIYAIDPVAGNIKKTIKLGNIGQIKGALLSPDGRFLYLPDTNGRKVFVVDTSNDMVKGPIETKGSPAGVALSPDGKTLYIADGQYASLVILNLKTKKVIKEIPIGGQPAGIAISQDGRFLFVSNMMSYNVTVIDTEHKEAVANIPVGAYPVGIVASPDGKRVYVANYNENTVSIIDTASNKEIARVVTTSTPFKIAVWSEP